MAFPPSYDAQREFPTHPPHQFQQQEQLDQLYFLSTNSELKSVIVILLLADQHKCNMLKQGLLLFPCHSDRTQLMEMVIGTPEYDQLKSLYPSLLINRASGEWKGKNRLN
uniref:BPM/SPOP BACK domain-containing protein n=1 Tax=Oryza glumipatula TaxID=40148 RepID=A0A0E0ASF7_9ORYZ